MTTTGNLVFKKYRKIKPTIARILTQEDFERWNGIIETHEGSRPFKVGDFLARDEFGVWPICGASITSNYQQISAPDIESYAKFQSLNIREACVRDEPFMAGGLHGQAEYVHVREGESEWPCEPLSFFGSYEEVFDE